VSTSVSRARASFGSISLPRPRLTVVPRLVEQPRRLPFVLLVVALLGAGLVGLLLLNTSMERGAFRVTALRSESAALSARQQQLELQVAAEGDPQEVASKALALGMVQNPSPAFLSLRTGRVVGRSVAGTASDRFDIGTKIGPSVDRLGKVSADPGTAGADLGVGVGSGVVEHRAVERGGKAAAKSGADGATGTRHPVRVPAGGARGR
jgi:hypothetical protein